MTHKGNSSRHDSPLTSVVIVALWSSRRGPGLLPLVPRLLSLPGSAVLFWAVVCVCVCGGVEMLTKPSPHSLQEKRNSLSIWGLIRQPHGESCGGRGGSGALGNAHALPTPPHPPPLGTHRVHHGASAALPSLLGICASRRLL